MPVYTEIDDIIINILINDTTVLEACLKERIDTLSKHPACKSIVESLERVLTSLQDEMKVVGLNVNTIDVAPITKTTYAPLISIAVKLDPSMAALDVIEDILGPHFPVDKWGYVTHQEYYQLRALVGLAGKELYSFYQAGINAIVVDFGSPNVENLFNAYPGLREAFQD